MKIVGKSLRMLTPERIALLMLALLLVAWAFIAWLSSGKSASVPVSKTIVDTIIVNDTAPDSVISTPQKVKKAKADKRERKSKPKNQPQQINQRHHLDEEVN